MKARVLLCFALVASSATAAIASNLTFSLGVRETGSTAAIGDDGGTGGSIEWVDLDLHVVPLNDAWQKVTIDLASPQSVTGFTGDGALDGAAGTIEHIRILNSDGITKPVRLWFDELIYTEATGNPVNLGWDGLTLGSEYRFQEPSFSGSTSGNVNGGSSSAVTDTMAFAGEQSYLAEFQFVDDDPTRWIRYTTFSTSVGLAGGNPTIGFDGQLSFWVKGREIPEPSVLVIAAVAGLACLLPRVRN